MMTVKRRSAASPSVPTMKRLTCSKYAALSRGPVSTTGKLLPVGGFRRMPRDKGFFRRTGPPGEDDDAVREPHESFEAL